MSDSPAFTYEPRYPSIKLVSLPPDPDRVGDGRDGRIYEMNDTLRLALEVALATGRPLLLRGEPGTGKSSFAAFVARCMRRPYAEFVVTSRSRAQDLMYRFDAVRKLADAQPGNRGIDDARYVEPGPLWSVLEPETATAQWRTFTRAGSDATPEWPRLLEGAGSAPAAGSVLLIDEIDKADADFPNDLLVPLGSLQFSIPELGGQTVPAKQPGAEQTFDSQEGEPRRAGLLVVITTNRERDLPDAFLRRCVAHTLDEPNEAHLFSVGQRHFGDSVSDALLEAVAEAVCVQRERAKKAAARVPSTAEFLDAVHACRDLKVPVDTISADADTTGEGSLWAALMALTVDKR